MGGGFGSSGPSTWKAVKYDMNILHVFQKAAPSIFFSAFAPSPLVCCTVTVCAHVCKTLGVFFSLFYRFVPNNIYIILL